MSNKLTNYDVKEISLVSEGAVQEKFLLLKSKGGNMSGLLLDKIRELELDSAMFEELLKKFELSEADKELFASFLKLHKAAEKSEKLVKAVAALFKEEEKPEDKKEEGEKKEEEKKPELSEDAKKAVEEEKAKAAEITKQKEQITKEKEKLEKENKELKEKELKAEYLEKAKGFKKLAINLEKFAEVLRKSKELLPDETFVELERVLKAADASLEMSRDFKSIFEEIGTSKAGATGKKAELEKLIDEKVKSDKKITREKAIVQIMKERPDMVEVINEKEDK